MTTTRTAVVTGAARGIGAAVAKRLASDGFAVACVDLQATSCEPIVENIEAAGGKAFAVGLDVADEQAVRPASSAWPRDSAPRPYWSTTPASPGTTCCSR